MLFMFVFSWSQMGNPEHDKFEGHPQLHKVRINLSFLMILYYDVNVFLLHCQMIANIYWRGEKISS